MTKSDFMTTDLKPGDKVRYIPKHGDHENGIVSSIGVSYVFVRFKEGVKACRSKDLVKYD